MSFGESQLKKFGWKKGQGLGREENGISDAIRPKLKFNTSGLGHDQSEEFTFHWWDHLYNKAAKNMSVKKNKVGKIEIVKSQDLEVSTKKSSLKNKETPSCYGNFVKGSILEGNTMTPAVRSQTDEESSEHQEKSLELIKNYSDNELFQMCGGLTAHKGARHGLTMSAKLARLEQQEKAFLELRNSDNNANDYKSKKKIKKLLKESNVLDPPREVDENLSTPFEEGEISKSKKSKKKKRKLKDEELIAEELIYENNVEDSSNTIDQDCNQYISKSKKKKKKKKKGNCDYDSSH